MLMTRLVLFALLAAVPAGCAEQMLGNARIRDSIAGSLGLQAADLTIVDRRADGLTNTNVIVEARGNGRYVCTINGGNLLTFGMTNAPYCRRPGAT